MSSCVSTTNANDLIALLLGGVAVSSATKPATWYAALTTTVATSGVPGVEMTGTSYARVAITNDQVTGFNAPVAGNVTNKNIVQFPKCTDVAGWSGGAQAMGVQLYDALGGGNAGPFAPLTTPSTILLNQQPEFDAGQLSFTMTVT